MNARLICFNEAGSAGILPALSGANEGLHESIEKKATDFTDASDKKSDSKKLRTSLTGP